MTLVTSASCKGKYKIANPQEEKKFFLVVVLSRTPHEMLNCLEIYCLFRILTSLMFVVFQELDTFDSKLA